MKASLVSAACEAVDAMKIARAKVAEMTKDLARPTVMHIVCSPLLLAAPTPPEHSCAATNPGTHRGWFDRGALRALYNERCGRLFALGRSERGATCGAHTDVIAPNEVRSSPI
jgi:hypothetical protein